MNNENFVIRPKHPKGEDGYKTFSVRLRDDLVEKINDISARTGYSRNELIGKLLNYAVERCVIKNEPGTD